MVVAMPNREEAYRAVLAELKNELGNLRAEIERIQDSIVTVERLLAEHEATEAKSDDGDN